MATTTDTTKTAQERPGAKHMFVQAMHGVRYLVTDVARSVAFYTTHLGFTLVHQQLPAFASVSSARTRRVEPRRASRERSPGVYRNPEESGTPLPERHGDRAWWQANPGRGSRWQSHRVVRACPLEEQRSQAGYIAGRMPAHFMR